MEQEDIIKKEIGVEDEEYLKDVLHLINNNKLRSVSDPFVLKSNPIQNKIKECLATFDNKVHSERNDWAELSELINVLKIMYETKVNSLDK